jgi:fumarate reductase flavoprotein subunit
MSASDQVFDVVVVGGGLAGWVAAARAQELGASVLVVERSARALGWGNSLISGGVLHAVLRDPRGEPEQLLATIMDLTDGHADRAVAAAWAHNAAPTIAWIEAHGGDLMTDPRFPLRARVFAPVKPTVPGVRSEGFGTERFLTHLAQTVVNNGGAIRQPARAIALVADGSLWGVDLAADEGDERVVGRAVVLCDGGFQAAPELLRQYVGTEKVKLRAADTAVGDGLRMGLSVGGVAVHMRGFYGHILARGALDNDALWPYPILDQLAAVGIVVSPGGDRFVDEGYGGVNTTNQIAWSATPLDNWLIMDDVAWERHGREGVTPPNPHIEEHGGQVLSGPTIAELAALAGIDPVGLARTVAELSEQAAATPPRSGDVHLDVPPFYGIPVVAGVTFTLGGLQVDGSARVVDSRGTPIVGLYAAGGTMGGLHGGPRVGYAGGLLEAAVFGLLAGAHAARLDYLPKGTSSIDMA